MKGVVLHGRAPAENVKVEDVPVPTIKAPTEVLVKIHAASLNPLDLHIIHGLRFTPAPADAKEEVFPLGVDGAGEVTAVGADVKRIKVGDKVWIMSGGRLGTLSEHYVSDEKSIALAPAPEVLPLSVAAGVPVVYLTGLQALRKLGAIDTPKTRGLIIGGSAATGIAGIQLAKHFGASTVIAVSSGKNAEFVRGIGADDIIDYTTTPDWADAISKKIEGKLDWVYDCIGKAGTFESALKILKPDGRFASTNPNSHKPSEDEIAKAKAGTVPTFFGIWAQASVSDLDTLKGLAEIGVVKPVVDRTYPLDKISEAVTYLGTGRAKGKVIILIGAKE